MTCLLRHSCLYLALQFCPFVLLLLGKAFSLREVSELLAMTTEFEALPEEANAPRALQPVKYALKILAIYLLAAPAGCKYAWLLSELLAMVAKPGALPGQVTPLRIWHLCVRSLWSG